ncbi:MAG: ATP-binding protein [Clostridium perfringens]
MEALDRILAKVKNQDMTTTMTKSSMAYKCPKCKDTGWILIERAHAQPLATRCTCQFENNVERAWKEFGLDPNQVKTIAEFETLNNKLLENIKTKVLNYASNFDKGENEWFLFMGQPGAGKTHLATGLGAILFKDKKRQVIYMPYTEAIQGLKGTAKDYDKYITLLEKYKNAEVLVIDDLFKDKVKNGQIIAQLNEIDMKHIYPLLNYRYYKNLVTIISTECDIAMLEILDKALAGRIVERAGRNMVIFRGADLDYRFKNLRRKKNE